MYSSEDIIKRYQSAMTERSQFQSIFDDCYDLALPRRMSISDTTVGQARNERIFDETAVSGTQEFASKLQAGLVPSFSSWAELRAGMEFPDRRERDRINRELSPVTQFVFENIHASNFSSQTHESFLDLAIGTGNLLCEETQSSEKPFTFTAIGIPHYVMDTDPSGNVWGMFRKRKMKWRDIPIEYPRSTNLPAKYSPDQMVEILDVVTRDRTSNEEKYMRRVCTMGKEDILTEEYKGEGSNPYITFRWSKIPMERYGRGPLMDCLPSIKTLNLTVQLILENAQMAISGMYNVEDDGILNADTIQLVPGALIPHAPGAQGLRPIAAAGRFDVAQLILQEFRQNIKRALFLDMLGDPDKTPASATEVAARQADLAARIGSSFARLHDEFVEPVIKRCIYIMRRKGLIDLPEVNGQQVKIVATSPLAQRFQQEDVMNYVNYAQALNQLYGPQITTAILDQQKGAEFLADRFTVDPQLNRTEEDQAAYMQMIQEAMQQNPEGAQQAVKSAGPKAVA